MKLLNAEERANELILKFASKDDVFKLNKRSISNAIKCCDEIIRENCHYSEYKNPIIQNLTNDFWVNVKKQLEKKELEYIKDKNETKY